MLLNIFQSMAFVILKRLITRESLMTTVINVVDDQRVINFFKFH